MDSKGSSFNFSAKSYCLWWKQATAHAKWERFLLYNLPVIALHKYLVSLEVLWDILRWKCRCWTGVITVRLKSNRFIWNHKFSERCSFLSSTAKVDHHNFLIVLMTPDIQQANCKCTSVQHKGSQIDMVLQYTRSVLRKILNGVLNWWRLMLVTKLHSTRFKIEPLSSLTTTVEVPEPAPRVATRQLCESLTVPSKSQQEQTDGVNQEFFSLEEETKESRKRIMKIENDIECIRSELDKLQTEWECRQHHLLAEWNDCKEQICDECSEQTMEIKDLERPLKSKAPRLVMQAQRAACRQRKDYTMRDEVDRPCSERVTQKDFLSQFDESDQAEMMSCGSEPYVKHCITAMPLHSFPRGPTSLTSSVPSYNNSRRGSNVALPYRFKAHLGNDQPLKAYAPRCIFDVQVGHRVKVILPSGKIGAGVVKYIGGLPQVPEICFGVELDFPENGLRNGVFAGNYYFHCKPSQGVFVNFSKVLMILE